MYLTNQQFFWHKHVNTFYKEQRIESILAIKNMILSKETGLKLNYYSNYFRFQLWLHFVIKYILLTLSHE